MSSSILFVHCEYYPFIAHKVYQLMFSIKTYKGIILYLHPRYCYKIMSSKQGKEMCVLRMDFGLGHGTR